MKYLKIIFITILLFIILIIPVNAATLTLPDLPGDYEDYIIFDSSSLGGNYSGIVALTFNNLNNMYVGNYEEFLDELNLEYIEEYENTYQTHDILYFRHKDRYSYNLELNYYRLVGNDWEYCDSQSELNYYRYGNTSTSSINKSDIFYSSKDVIDLSDGSVFFSKGSWMMAALVRPMLGIIPFLIGLLIVSVAFWKGLQFLFRTLQKA